MSAQRLFGVGPVRGWSVRLTRMCVAAYKIVGGYKTNSTIFLKYIRFWDNLLWNVASEKVRSNMPDSIYTPAYQRLCYLLTEARKEAGLTQKELAERLGQQQSFVSKYERGQRRLDIIELIEIANAIGIKASNLIRQIEANYYEGQL